MSVELKEMSDVDVKITIRHKSGVLVMDDCVVYGNENGHLHMIVKDKKTGTQVEVVMKKD